MSSASSRRIVVTGCNGSVGRRCVLAALKAGHTVVGIDAKQVEGDQLEFADHPGFSFQEVDLRDYDKTLDALRRANAEAVIQLAAIPTPEDYVAVTHNTNVVISWNVLRASAELGINRIAQASSVNVVTLVWSQGPVLDYFPIDEDHPCRPDEPYGLSKLIAELQADTIVRRYPSMRIASLRLSWSLPNKQVANLSQDPDRRKNDLWGYVHEDAGAEAFLLAVTNEDDRWHGHEAFFITAPDTTMEEDSMTLKERFYPNVPVKEGKRLEGHQGFFDCSKAERLLGWVHRVPGAEKQ
ncbi:NAD(P)-binding protein [Panus rudis PR-1116 ss-1]|nr:NAD(P)-binding protein [Panus rudis PR-1116 ss-1]